MFDFSGGQAAAFCLTFAVGAGGYFLFRLLRIPNPALLGSMAATGAMNAMGLYPSFNTRLVAFVSNVAIGVMIGQQIDRTVARRMARAIVPVAIQTAGMLLLSLTCGLVMRLTSNVDLATSLISGAAGGITEMIVFGVSIDAQVSVIAFVQLFRVVVFLALIPYLAIVAEKITGVSRASRGTETAQKTSPAFFAKGDYLKLVPLAFAGGAFAAWLNVPTGAMLGAMFAAGGMALFWGRKYKFNERLRFAAQIGLGLVTGERITPQIAAQLGNLFLPAVAVTLVMLAGSTLLAVLLYKTSDWGLTTCLLCAAPAGLSQIVSFAEDVGADPLTTSVFHTARIVGIVSFYPWIVLPLA
ncbi:MAG: AbrB family transcriptional regulator [Synergistaceae bacterium]|jgi:membrane AbrB-like protein|nr:AbrB family transcriptional regulator [Synergistaceae bacterium]